MGCEVTALLFSITISPLLRSIRIVVFQRRTMISEVMLQFQLKISKLTSLNRLVLTRYKFTLFISAKIVHDYWRDAVQSASFFIFFLHSFFVDLNICHRKLMLLYDGEHYFFCSYIIISFESFDFNFFYIAKCSPSLYICFCFYIWTTLNYMSFIACIRLGGLTFGMEKHEDCRLTHEKKL